MYAQFSHARFTHVFWDAYFWSALYFLRPLPDMAELLEPLEHVINEALIPAVSDHTVTKVERDLLGLPVCTGGLAFTFYRSCSDLIFCLRCLNKSY